MASPQMPSEHIGGLERGNGLVVAEYGRGTQCAPKGGFLIFLEPPVPHDGFVARAPLLIKNEIDWRPIRGKLCLVLRGDMDHAPKAFKVRILERPRRDRGQYPGILGAAHGAVDKPRLICADDPRQRHYLFVSV